MIVYTSKDLVHFLKTGPSSQTGVCSGVRWSFNQLFILFIKVFSFFSYLNLEDILKRDNAVWISPDGQKLVYATFNDTMVEEFKWKIFGAPSDALLNPYPKEEKMRYPKVMRKTIFIDFSTSKLSCMKMKCRFFK